jgi:outer membrane protein TolC
MARLGSSPAILLLLLLASNASAAPTETAPPPIRAMGLPEAIAYPRAHHPAVTAERARIAARRADAAVPRAGWLPRFAATAQLFGPPRISAPDDAEPETAAFAQHPAGG